CRVIVGGCVNQAESFCLACRLPGMDVRQCDYFALVREPQIPANMGIRDSSSADDSDFEHSLVSLSMKQKVGGAHEMPWGPQATLGGRFSGGVHVFRRASFRYSSRPTQFGSAAGCSHILLDGWTLNT